MDFVGLAVMWGIWGVLMRAGLRMRRERSDTTMEEDTQDWSGWAFMAITGALLVAATFWALS